MTSMKRHSPGLVYSQQVQPLLSLFAGFLLGLGFSTGWQGGLRPEIAHSVMALGTAFFPDIEQGSFYDASVLDLVRKGIVRGYEDGRFGPHDPVTRAQVAVMLQRYDREVVQPLREQLKRIRELLELGECGDGAVQVGEECDDGNTEEGDGCSPTCLEEVALPRPRPEGKGRCVVAGCSGELCVDERLDVGVSICLWKEEFSCYESAVCERQADGQCGWTETPDFHACLENLQGKTAVCEELEQELSKRIRASRACRTNEDCTVLVRGCGPFLTCGIPMNTASIDVVKQAIAEYVKQCPEDRAVCAACIQRRAICERGLCRLDPPIHCSQEVRTCPDGTEVHRNPDLDCTFDLCPEEAIVCGDGVCEEGEAGTCPTDCPVMEEQNP
jgi:cysteine-rich repeat protein